MASVLLVQLLEVIGSPIIFVELPGLDCYFKWFWKRRSEIPRQDLDERSGYEMTGGIRTVRRFGGVAHVLVRVWRWQMSMHNRRSPRTQWRRRGIGSARDC